MDGIRRGRRSPAPGERRRDPERTKQRIRDAALVEFSAKGFAGARVSEIAAIAGVNKQLISYYFGGKEGLYQELAAGWREAEGAFVDPALELPQLVARYVRESVHHRDLGRLLLWEGLTGEGTDASELVAQAARDVEDLRRRQSLGEFPADLDPSYFLLALFSAAGASIAFPHLVQAICGQDPASARFADEYAEQLGRLLRHLRPERPRQP
jgi:TetR/AcrR family transcriptional regulator